MRCRVCILRQRSWDCRFFFFFFQAEDGIRDVAVTGVQTCALPISQGSIEGRLRRSPHDLLGRMDARWIQQSTDRGTLVASAQGVAGLHTERDFQLILGGLNGLRAYPVQAIAGRRLWRLNAEQRWKVADVL